MDFVTLNMYLPLLRDHSSMLCFIYRDERFIDNMTIWDEHLGKHVDHSLPHENNNMVIDPFSFQHDS